MTAQNSRDRLPTKFSFRNKFASLKEHKKLCREPNFYNFWTKSSDFLRVSKKPTFIKICKFRHFLCDFSSFRFCHGLIFGVPRISFIYSCRTLKGASFDKKNFFSKVLARSPKTYGKVLVFWKPFLNIFIKMQLSITY